VTGSHGQGHDHSGTALAAHAAHAGPSSQAAAPAENGVTGSGGEAYHVKAPADAERVAGPRRVPERTIPVPAGLDDTETTLIAAPYSPFWNLAPADAVAWQAIQQERAEASVPALAALRTRLGVAIEAATFGGVNGYLLSPNDLDESRSGRLVFYLHGGGYVLGQGESGTLEATLMAAYGGYRVLCVDYRLAPQAPYPAALDDAAAAWRAVIGEIDPTDIAVAGISAGGGLALALLLRLKAENRSLPAALALGSPWSDMTKTGDSYATNEWLDNVLVSYDGYLSRAGHLYAGGQDLRQPGLSPIYGDLQSLPPAALFTGTRDLFLSNTVRTHRKLREAGVTAELHVFDGMAHAQYALHANAPATTHTYGEMAKFFDRYLGLGALIAENDRRSIGGTDPQRKRSARYRDSLDSNISTADELRDNNVHLGDGR